VHLRLTSADSRIMRPGCPCHLSCPCDRAGAQAIAYVLLSPPTWREAGEFLTWQFQPQQSPMLKEGWRHCLQIVQGIDPGHHARAQDRQTDRQSWACVGAFAQEQAIFPQQSHDPEHILRQIVVDRKPPIGEEGRERVLVLHDVVASAVDGSARGILRGDRLGQSENLLPEALAAQRSHDATLAHQIGHIPGTLHRFGFGAVEIPVQGEHGVRPFIQSFEVDKAAACVSMAARLLRRLHAIPCCVRNLGVGRYVPPSTTLIPQGDARKGPQHLDPALVPLILCPMEEGSLAIRHAPQPTAPYSGTAGAESHPDAS